MAAARVSTDRIQTAWQGAVTQHETPELRERLYELLGRPGGTSLRLDVREVTSIDRSGIALLIGARNRADATGRTFVLIDSAGVVSQALSHLHVLASFLVTEVVRADPGPVLVGTSAPGADAP